jgi:hypothetical protein
MYVVKDTATGLTYRCATVDEVQTSVDWIVSGTQLNEWEEEEVLSIVEEVRDGAPWVHSRLLDVEVVLG